MLGVEVPAKVKEGGQVGTAASSVGGKVGHACSFKGMGEWSNKDDGKVVDEDKCGRVGVGGKLLSVEIDKVFWEVGKVEVGGV